MTKNSLYKRKPLLSLAIKKIEWKEIVIIFHTVGGKLQTGPFESHYCAIIQKLNHTTRDPYNRETLNNMGTIHYLKNSDNEEW